MLINQSVAEFFDKFEEHNLTPMISLPPEKVYIKADSKSMFRIIENLYNNIYKYAMPGTRVYIDMEKYEEYMDEYNTMRAEDAYQKAEEAADNGDMKKYNEYIEEHDMFEGRVKEWIDFNK